ncbi:MAG: DUF2849 domain-containing protein [Alphaproteobacteria bacterium]|nr:DUF2849 domain-containing protein [Alphaproteobacteria bacterium]
MPQVLTANRLLDGEVVYLASDGAWVEELASAAVIATKAEGEAALVTGIEAERNQKIVHAYLFEVIDTGVPLRPVKQREVIRAAGPTVRSDLGKQARS